MINKRRALIGRVRALYRKMGLEDEGCNLCGGRNFMLICESDRFGFDLKKQYCQDCGLVQTHPSLPDAFHRQFYATMYRKLYSGDEEVDYATLLKGQKKRSEGIIELFSRTVPDIKLPDLSVFEIGCSCGGVLEGLRPRVKAVAGSDLDEEGIAWGREHLGLDLQLAFIPDNIAMAEPRLFVLSHVLEHLYDPLQTLRDIRALMGPNDLLYVAVPGMNMVAKGSYRGDLRRYFHIGHVTDFTRGTMAAMAAQAGLETIAVDEEVVGLFRKSGKESLPWLKSPEDSVENIERIEAARRRKFGIW